ncbi:protein DEHYDRATION-INDUCED 19 homolog 3-like [Phalaenopsis equestris]|uniref:protein DEHYDRATION-INDUCED 19 homolog 3-like n=1 Tax=Phalaenopsis equestris TaxID=78828 RepID=UPI0009E5FBF6|nr:protein DEHYDRATION-INDUCED 19 homolog 3-like [Phalaenopsis equestris]
MDSDSWSRLSLASKRHQSTLQSRYDQYLGIEEIEGDEDEWRPEFPCPLCDEDFDIVGLCVHIDDDHPFEAKNGVCPICLGGVGMDMVGHITVQHADLFKSQHKRRLRKGSSGSHGAFNFLRKELRDGSLQSLLGGSSRFITPSHAAPDPLLSSFISNVPIADFSKVVEPEPLAEGKRKISEEKVVESAADEMVRRREFAQQIVLSTVFDGIS